MNEILKYDSNFTESKFKSFADNVFIQIHLHIMTKEPEKIKHFVNDSLYKTIYNKTEELNQKKLIQMYDEINVKQTTILNYKVQDNKMIIEVNITSRYMDYLIDEDGNFVSGINNRRIEKENYLTFEKPIDYLSTGSVRKCPGCGASIDVNANGQCAYCGTIYNLKDKDWVLVSLQTN